jgi:Tol biopolymer transport system component
MARGRDPVFTSDGAWVVYSQQHHGQWRLWRMRPDGSGKGAIGSPGTSETYDEIRPAVSPDGRFLVYVSLENQRERLRIRRFDGSGDRPLLQAGDASDPVW